MFFQCSKSTPGIGICLEIVPGDDIGGLAAQLAYPLENVFGRTCREICFELFVNGQVGRQDKEVVQAAFQMEPGDKSPHKAGLAHAGRQCKTEGGKIPVK